MDSTNEDLVSQLERRVRALEDQISIYQLLSSYGPAADSMSTSEAVSIWTEDGIYDPGSAPVPPMHGRDEIAAILTLPSTPVWNGSGHISSMPLVAVDGDRAVCIGYHQLYVRDDEDDSFCLRRLTASRWDMVRREDGWKVARRTHRLLDGSQDARTLLRDALLEIRGGAEQREQGIDTPTSPQVLAPAEGAVPRLG